MMAPEVNEGPGAVPRTVAQKMGIKADSRAHLLAAPLSAVTAIELPPLRISAELDGQFDYLHVFSVSQADLDAWFPVLREYLAVRGMLWVSWPKAKKLGTDLSLPTVIRIGYSHSMVESTNVSIDDTWTALKFTYPKPGKVYHNSFGTLPKT